MATLRELAAAATSGPWVANVLGSEGYSVMGPTRATGRGRVWVARCGMEAWAIDKNNAEYLAAVSPDVVIGLLDTILELRGQLDRITTRIQSADTHRPCCSSHKRHMTCEQYRRTHCVQVRPCCAIDAALLAEEDQS